MRKYSISKRLMVILGVLFLCTAPVVALANGTDTLGPPNIDIAEGSGIVSAGVGLAESQPGTIDINVPGQVVQVLLYWEGQMSTDVVGDNTIEENGTEITGTLIGGPLFFFPDDPDAYSSAFRADITDLGLVGPGLNTLSVGGLNFSKVANGAGVLVIFDDGTPTTPIQLRDGLDLAFERPIGAIDPETVPQTFNFAASSVDRTANLDMFFSSVSGRISGDGADRPTSIEVTVDGTETVFSNLLASVDGEEWDTVSLDINIPADATTLTVQAFARDDNGSGNLPASFAWTAAGLYVPPPCEGIIGDYVWLDDNRDGCQDPDAGIEGVEVCLYENADCANNVSGTLVGCQVTDLNGFYLFENLECGKDYEVKFTRPAGLVETEANQECTDNPEPGDRDINDSDCVADERVCVSLGEDTFVEDLTVDCGFVPPPDPGIDIEKTTDSLDNQNSTDSDFDNEDDPNGVGVPVVPSGSEITWTYKVTNTGNLPFAFDDVMVTDSVDSVNPVSFVPASDDGDDNILSPGEMWFYTAQGTALDLMNPPIPPAGVEIVDGCNPAGVPGGEREAYMNQAKVEVPGDDDTDDSHYCNPPDVDIMIQKTTDSPANENPVDSDFDNEDSSNGVGVPVVAAGSEITWTYEVTNTGNQPFASNDVAVTDSVASVNAVLTFDPTSDVGSDGILSPGEVWRYTATGTAADLKSPPNDVTIVSGCNPDNVPGSEREAYMNVATVVVPSGGDTDPSHYCNPPDPGIDIQKTTDSPDNQNSTDSDFDNEDESNGVGVPVIPQGSDIIWTYKVTNTGNQAFAIDDVEVTDSVASVNLVLTFNPASDVGNDGILSPGEIWFYTAKGMAADLMNPPGDVTIVDGCNPAGVPGGEREAYMNQAKVEVPGDDDTDDSHYCNPPDVDIMIQKTTDSPANENPVDSDFDNEDSSNGVGVPVVAAGSEITWTYEVTNTGNQPFASNDVAVTDSVASVNAVLTFDPTSDDGSDQILSPGEMWLYTATGTAADLMNPPNDVTIVPGCNPNNVPGGERDAYMNTAKVVVPNGGDTDPSHYCNPPECGLTVEKSCETPAPPSADGKCDGKLQQFTMIWDGADGTQISGVSNNSGGTVDNGDEVTFSGPFSNNDVIVNVGSGQSTFHVSCSDKDMDGDTATNEDQQQVSSFGRDCGKDQGNGKGSSGINDWLLEGFIDKNNAVLDCTSDSGPGASSCEFTPVEASCDTLGKPSNLTFVYTGGGCPGDNDQGSKSDCSGSIDSSLPVTVTLDSGTLGPVNPGETFIVPTTGSNTTIILSNNGSTETNDVHTSCSAPLAAGDSYGSMTLVALDGQGTGTNILYSYLVSNQGSVDVTDITVDDDQLGDIGTIDVLKPGDSETLTTTAFITETTTNIATVDGDGAPGAECLSDSNPVTVTVLPPPPCDASIAFKELKDDAIKWTLSNDSAQRKATMETFTLVFPADFGAIKEVKLDGAIFKAGDSNTFPDGVGSGDTIDPNDWTETDVSKRQLDQGESRTLEVKFTQKDNNASQGDFDLIVTFEEGCRVDF